MAIKCLTLFLILKTRNPTPSLPVAANSEVSMVGRIILHHCPEKLSLDVGISIQTSSQANAGVLSSHSDYDGSQSRFGQSHLLAVSLIFIALTTELYSFLEQNLQADTYSLRETIISPMSPPIRVNNRFRFYGFS